MVRSHPSPRFRGANGSRRSGSKRPHRAHLGLALCGGGLLGVMYEVGALKALDEALGPEMSVMDFDSIVGTSAGAIVGTLLANRVPPAKGFDILMEGRRDALNFHWSDIYGPSFLDLLSLGVRGVRKVSVAASAVVQGKARDPIEIAEELFPRGLLSLEPVRRYLRRLAEARKFKERFDELPVKLWVTAMDLDTGDRVLFGPGQIEDVPVLDTVVASCAIPGVFEPIPLKGQYLIDGGTGSAAHSDVLFHAGARVIVVVNPVVPIRNDRSRVCIPSIEGRCASLRDRGIPMIIDQAFRIHNYTKMEMGLARFHAQHPKVKVFRLEPDPAEAAAYAYNPMDYTHRKEVLEWGYRSTKAQLEDGKLRRALLRMSPNGS